MLTILNTLYIIFTKAGDRSTCPKCGKKTFVHSDNSGDNGNCASCGYSC